MKRVKVRIHEQHIDDATAALLARLSVDGRGRKAWRKLAADLGMSDKSRGYLSQVAAGERKASNALRAKLGLHPLTITVTPCPSCGGVHLAKRCPECSTPRKYPKHPVTRLSRLTNRERAKREFEAWARDVFDLTPDTRDAQDDYLDTETELLWMCWLESRLVAASGGVDAG